MLPANTLHRYDVVDARRAQGIVGHWADQPALAGDEGGGDGAGLAAETVGDPPGEGVARVVQGGGEA